MPQRYHKLTVVGKSFRQNDRTVVKVRCDCGTIKIVQLSNVTSGRTQSCGCHRREQAKRLHTTHKAAYTQLYNVWNHMLQRCENPRNSSYKDYGGRGITVCKVWHNFTSFQKWALTTGYNGKLEIDRKNNNSGYTPSNCRWATRRQQTHNARKRRNNTSGYIGVSYCKRNGLYVACAQENGHLRHLGYYQNPILAARQRDAFVRKHYDQYATLNFPPKEKL